MEVCSLRLAAFTRLTRMDRGSGGLKGNLSTSCRSTTQSSITCSQLSRNRCERALKNCLLFALATPLANSEESAIHKNNDKNNDGKNGDRPVRNGGQCRARTCDLLLVRQAL